MQIKTMGILLLAGLVGVPSMASAFLWGKKDDEASSQKSDLIEKYEAARGAQPIRRSSWPVQEEDDRLEHAVPVTRESMRGRDIPPMESAGSFAAPVELKPAEPAEPEVPVQEPAIGSDELPASVQALLDEVQAEMRGAPSSEPASAPVMEEAPDVRIPGLGNKEEDLSRPMRLHSRKTDPAAAPAPSSTPVESVKSIREKAAPAEYFPRAQTYGLEPKVRNIEVIVDGKRVDPGSLRNWAEQQETRPAPRLNPETAPAVPARSAGPIRRTEVTPAAVSAVVPRPEPEPRPVSRRVAEPTPEPAVRTVKARPVREPVPEKARVAVKANVVESRAEADAAPVISEPQAWGRRHSSWQADPFGGQPYHEEPAPEPAEVTRSSSGSGAYSETLSRPMRRTSAPAVASPVERAPEPPSTTGWPVMEVASAPQPSRALDQQMEKPQVINPDIGGVDASLVQGASAVYVNPDIAVLKPGLAVSVNVVVAGKSEIMESDKRVSDEGTISLPLLGNVYVSGLTLNQLSNMLKERYSEAFVNPLVLTEFSLTSMDNVSPWGYVTVLGRVTQPGKIPIPPTRDMTVTAVIQLSGGLAPSAKESSIKVSRQMPDGSVKRINVDLKAVAKRGKVEEDILLKAGDVVFVPEEFF